MRAETRVGLIRVTSPNDWERVAREFFQTTCDEAVRVSRYMGKFRERLRTTPRVRIFRRNDAGGWDAGF